jgi:hypothetical protein
MDDSSIAGRTEKLRREIGLILQEERKFRSLNVHTQAARMARASRELRILCRNGTPPNPNVLQ